MSPNIRKYTLKARTPKKRKLVSQPDDERPRSHKKKGEKQRKARGRVLGKATHAGLQCYGRQNLGKYLRFAPKEGTQKNFRPTVRRVNCDFCGKRRVLHKCLACGEVFCMLPPHNLEIPGANPPRKFPSNGLLCWHLVHGHSKWGDL